MRKIKINNRGDKRGRSEGKNEGDLLLSEKCGIGGNEGG
jgi:hypothetical protein